jgi:hypothetical protein
VSISYYPYKYLYKLEELNMGAHLSHNTNKLGNKIRRGGIVDIKVFPPDLGLTSKNGNYMMFQTFTMEGGVGQSTSDVNWSPPNGTVCLPIPSGVGTTYEQGWDQQEVGLGGSAAGMAAEVLKGEKGFWETGGDIMDQGRTAVGGLGAKMGTVGRMVNVAATQQATGVATFSNTYITYQGPAFRDFNFSFSLKPLDQKESDGIRDIVSFFKVNAAPVQRAVSVSRIYEVPQLFGISYHNKTDPMKHMNKIGKCALTSINVVYGGDRFAVFHQDSAPVQVDLTLTFKEVQLLSAADMEAGY